MKSCRHCELQFSDEARYCSNCGRPLSEAPRGKGRSVRVERRGLPLFWATLLGSLLLSWILISVFQLPVFILGALLPLFFFGNRGAR